MSINPYLVAASALFTIGSTYAYDCLIIKPMRDNLLLEQCQNISFKKRDNQMFQYVNKKTTKPDSWKNNAETAYNLGMEDKATETHSSNVLDAQQAYDRQNEFADLLRTYTESSHYNLVTSKGAEFVFPGPCVGPTDEGS